jgi:hypothetical protein
MTDPTGLGTTAPAAPPRRAHLSLVPTPPGLTPVVLPPPGRRRRTAVRSGDLPLLATVTDDLAGRGPTDLFRSTADLRTRERAGHRPDTPVATTPTVAARHLVVDALAAGTAALLSDAGVAALVIGGPVIARQIHHPAGLTRGYAAVDLLVHPAAVPTATEALRDHGYRPEGLTLTGPTGCHRWRSPGSGAITVRLQSQPAGVGRPAGLFRELWEERAMLVFAGAEAPAPSARGIALLVALAAGRGPAAPRSGQQDLARAVQTLGPDTWLRATDLARTCRAQEAFRAGLDTLRPAAAGPRTTALPAPVARDGTSLPAAARAMIRGVLSGSDRRGTTVQRPAAAGWAVAALHSARRQLTTAGVADVDLPAPPPVGAADRPAVLATLDERAASCLERALVVQRFDAETGRPRDLVVAVTDPGPDRTPGCATDGDPAGASHAHAWLDGDAAPRSHSHELLRLPAPGTLSSR